MRSPSHIRHIPVLLTPAFRHISDGVLPSVRAEFVTPFVKFLLGASCWITFDHASLSAHRSQCLIVLFCLEICPRSDQLLRSVHFHYARQFPIPRLTRSHLAGNKPLVCRNWNMSRLKMRIARFSHISKASSCTSCSCVWAWVSFEFASVLSSSDCFGSRPPIIVYRVGGRRFGFWGS